MVDRSHNSSERADLVRISPISFPTGSKSSKSQAPGCCNSNQSKTVDRHLGQPLARLHIRPPALLGLLFGGAAGLGGSIMNASSHEVFQKSGKWTQRRIPRQLQTP